MKTQKCTSCQKRKPLSEFQNRYDGTGRLRKQCTDCLNAKKRDCYAKTKGGRLEARKTFRESDPKRCIKCGEV
ncbi:hypothetical protein KA005_46850, partial [bacterium]|nr:hypothetical protein [bacterium]